MSFLTPFRTGRFGPRPKLVSVASGKGGVGKSVVASSLALELARRHLRVVLVDLDIGGANLHVLFGEFHPHATLGDFLSGRTPTLDDTAITLGAFHGLKLVAGTGDSLEGSNLSRERKTRLMTSLKTMGTDVVVLDVGPGTSYDCLDFFLLGDVQLAVSTADPTSVVDVYRFIKLAAVRCALAAIETRYPASRRLEAEELATRAEVVSAAERIDPSLAAGVEGALASFEPCLLLNRVSHHTRANVQRLRALLKETMGSELTVLGAIPDDEAVEQSVRSFLPVVERHPSSPAARALVLAASTLLGLLAVHGERRFLRPVDESFGPRIA